MARFALHWLITAVALAVAAHLVPGISISSGFVLALSALALGFVNALVRPVLTVLTLPITVLTLGLFLLVVNGIAFGLAAFLVPGFRVAGLGPAILGSLVVAGVSWIIGSLTRRASLDV